MCRWTCPPRPRSLPDDASTALDLFMIDKYLERLGDHAVNIAEWVEFLKTGVHKSRKIV